MKILKLGSTGADVKCVQEKLKLVGYKLEDDDGTFGPGTQAAVMKFQKLKGLSEDGEVGPRTMSALPSNELPLHLFEVLEEEYISLNGRIEEKTVIKVKAWERKKHEAKESVSGHPAKGSESKQPELKTRIVRSYLNWDFHKGHIKDWKGFQKYLLDPRTNLVQKPRDLPKKKSRSRRRKEETYSDKHLNDLLTREKVEGWHSRKDVLATLNEVLGEFFYCPEDFRHVKFSESTEKLFELYPQKEQGRMLSPDELRQMNRFLLEDLFPEYLESISEIRLAANYQIRHEYQERHEKVSAALCLSGGGIRSGTFALGLLQGMARHTLLKEFDYLSTVSGGGYIGAWLTAWIHRHPKREKGLRGVTGDLSGATPGKKIDPEPPALRHLREYSNFLTPKAGLLSADTWAFVAIYVRNLMLNWSVIIPLLLAFLLIPRLGVAVIRANPGSDLLRFLLLPVGCFFVVWAVAYAAISRPSLRPRLIEKRPALKEKMGQRGFLKYCLLPLVLAACALGTFWGWTAEGQGEAINVTGLPTGLLFPLFGAGLAALALAVSIAVVGNSREIGIVAIVVFILTGSVGGALTWAGTTFSFKRLVLWNMNSWDTAIYVTIAVPLFMLMFMLAATFFAGFSSHLIKRVSDEDREWWARFSAWTLISAGAWALFSALVLFGPLALLESPRLMGAVGGISGIVALVLGRSAKTPANSDKAAQSGWTAYLASFLLPILAILFLAVFLAALSLLTSTLTPTMTEAVNNLGAPTTNQLTANRERFDTPVPPTTNQLDEQSRLPVEISNTKVGDLLAVGTTRPAEPRKPTDADVQHMRAVNYPRWWFFLGVMTLLFSVGMLLARAINLNLFSLHNSYRNRLIRGFLAASRERKLRRPNPFTGFDTADNVSMHELRPALLHEVDFKDLDGFANELKHAGQALAKRSSPSDEDQHELESAGISVNASEFLYSQLSKKGKAALDSFEPPSPLSPSQRVDLIEDLNRILEGDHMQLGKSQGFRTEPRTIAETEQEELPTAPLEPGREYHIHRNRRALDATFPSFIETCEYPPHRLLHVVNTTLNLVGGDNLAWQQRKAESFTVSPLHCGSYRVGYRRSRDYGGDDGISLGTAMAISGAAASSNMGYYTTSPVLSLVLTLFNVRLGWWLGNPGPPGSRTYTGVSTDDRPGEGSKRVYRRMSPTFSIGPVFSEAFGLTDDRSEYVYLTDGGHFENLGLYEMVLRRCQLIVVSDAAADANYEFNDLANAVRKVRIDLGIHIEFPDVPIYSKKPESEKEGGCYWSLGLIRYSDMDYKSDGDKADDGILIYIKPAVYDDEPEDVMHYKRTHPDFPNETTADQFFDEPQFESYRALGSYIMDQMCGSPDGTLTIEQFVTKAKENFFRLAPQAEKKYIGVFPKITPDDAGSAPDKKAIKPETSATGAPTQSDIKNA